jgi:ADP-heptose:LPS heptosyltransferase
MPLQPAKLLIIKHGAFGDVILADGAMRDIRAAFPQTEIVLLTTPAYFELMRRCPHIDRILLDPRAPFWRFGALVDLIRMFRAERFTWIFDLQQSGRTGHYRRLFFRKAAWSGRIPGPCPPSMIEGFKPLLEHAGIAAHHCLSPDVSWMAENVSALLKIHSVKKPYIALIPGCAANHPHKRWPYYSELSAALHERGYAVVTAPGPDEIELAQSIPGTTLLGPKGFLNWFELAGVLMNAHFIVGNDTGPSHLAACLGRPGLALFGPHTSATRTGIRRGAFDAIEAPDLGGLAPDTVLGEVLVRLARIGHRSAQQNSV